MDLIARALVDPNGLVTDVGSAAAESTARSLFSEQDVGSLAQMEQSVSRLDDMIANASNPNSAQELQALRDHIAQGIDEQTTKTISNNDLNGIPKGFYPDSDELNQEASVRRLGAMNGDPAWVDHQPYKQWEDPNFELIRHNNFERWAPPLDELNGREHDSVSAFRPWSQSLKPVPIYGYGIDPTTGFLRPGIIEDNPSLINKQTPGIIRP